MRPSVSQLLSWQPGQLGAAGQTLVNRAADLQRSAADLTSIGSGLSGVWSGAAAQAATTHHTRRAGEVDELAGVVHTAGQALLRAADSIGQARTSLRSARSAAHTAGCTVLDDGTVLPPARPPAPRGLTPEDLAAWRTGADATAAAQAAGAARLEQQIRAALTAAGAADDTSSAALSTLHPPTVSPAPQPVRMGLTGGQWAPIALPSCPTTPATPDEDEHGWLYNAVGGVGSGAWKVGPGMVGDVVGWIPLDAAQAVDDFTDRRYDDLSQWYDADTDSGVYRTADIGTQVGGFLVTGGAAALRGIPAAIKAAPAAVRAVGGAVRGAASAGEQVAAAVRGVRVTSLVTPEGVRVPTGVDLSSVGALLSKAKEPLSEALQKSKQLLGGRAPRNGQSFAGQARPLPTAELRAKYPEGVRYTDAGFPDFSPWKIKEVRPPALTGNRKADEIIANRLAGLTRTPDDYVWHHTEDVPVMQLVPKDLHRGTPHSGGYAIDKHHRSGGGGS